MGFVGSAWKLLKGAVEIGRIAENQSALHEDCSALNEKYIALERRVARLEGDDMGVRDQSEWKDDYEHQDIGLGFPVYAPTSWSDSAESPHWLCPQCFDNDKRSYLRPAPGTYTIGQQQHWSCSRDGCKIDFITSCVPN